MPGPRLPNGVRRLFRLPRSRSRLRAELTEEMQSHIALHTEWLCARGVSRAEAEAEALRRFGSTDEYAAYATQRAARRSRRLGVVDWLESWLQDIRFAHRQFGRNFGFTALAVVTLALGIGANTAIFTVVHRLLIAPLPYPDGDRIVKLVAGTPQGFNNPTLALLPAWQARARSLELIAGVTVDAIYLQDFGDTQDTIPAYITSNFLTLLGVSPVIGRNFTVDDEKPGAPSVAMISYGRWQRQFGGSRDALGATTTVVGTDGRPFTIIGVTPPEMGVPMARPVGPSGKLRSGQPAVWIPRSLDSLDAEAIFGKLRPGVTADAATRELQAIVDSDRAPGASALHVRAMRAQDFLDPRERQTVEVLFVAVGALLLIACANVASLLLSRAWTRRREFAVRTALGAGRGRLTRQVLTESVLLALTGGVLGVAVAWVTLRFILELRPPSLENLDGISIQVPVLLWSAGISVLTGILFGSTPALFAGARSIDSVLRNESRSTSGGHTARHVRSTLIVLEIAMSLVLLVGAGLLVRSFAALQRMPLGFDPHGLVAADINLAMPRSWTDQQRDAHRNELLARIQAIPGVSDASIGVMPGQAWRMAGALTTTPDASGHSTTVKGFATPFVTPSYFRLAGISLLEGRIPDSLTWKAATDAILPQEIVINQALARRLWPNASAVGRTVSSPDRGATIRQTVVGVVGDIRMPGGLAPEWTMEVYGPVPSRIGALLVILRTSLSEDEIVAAIRRVVSESDLTKHGTSAGPVGAVVRSITVGTTYLDESLAPARFAMVLLASFSVLALVLAGVGLYGVIAYSVTQRTREIGVRVALGATTASIGRLVVGSGMKLTILGVIIGVAVAAASTRLLASLLYGVSPADPITFTAITALVSGIALAACYIPARRATRVDPMAALRAD